MGSLCAVPMFFPRKRVIAPCNGRDGPDSDAAATSDDANFHSI